MLSSFSMNVFTGKFYSTVGNTFKITNAVATYNSTDALQGGLFGGVASGAKIENVIFENATLDIQAATEQTFETVSLGLFSGYVEEGAIVSGVTVGGTIKLGAVSLTEKYALNLWVNSEISLTGLTMTDVKLQVYGEDYLGIIIFAINPKTVTVDKDGNVRFEQAYGDDAYQEEKIYDIEI